MRNSRNDGQRGGARHTRLLLMMLPVVIASLVYGCKPSADDALARLTRDSIVSRAGVVDSARARVAAEVFVTYLEASREGSTVRAALDTLAQCGDGGAPALPALMLATWSLLPFEQRGDTIVARAAITTVAEQDVDRRGSGLIARQRIRTDVLEWDVFEGDDGWHVCNGLRFGFVPADSATTWRPVGATLESAQHLADSLYRVAPPRR